MLHEENLAAWCDAWYHLHLHGARVEDSCLGGYDDLAPTQEMGGEA